MLSFPRGRAPFVVWVAVLLAAMSLSAAVPRAYAQNQPFSLQVRVGYEGAYRLAEWFPVVVDVANDGPDVQAVLEWSLPGRPEEQVFRRTVDLPRGSRKRVAFDVYIAGFVRNGLLRLLDGSTELARRDVTLDTIDEGIFLIGVVSNDPALMNSLDALQLGSYTSARVRHLTPGELPESAAALRGVDALFLHTFDTAALTPAQRDALALWVSLGGQLVVSGGAGGQAAAAGLGDLLPVRTVGAATQGSLALLASLGGTDAASLPASTTLSRAEPQPDAEQLPAGSGLLFRHQYGAGLVSFSAFDFAALRGWSGEVAFWQQVLRQVVDTTSLGIGARLSQFNLLDRGVLKLSSLNAPSPWILLLFMLLYVLAIGPLNYVVLRRMRRLELAWITVPALVVVFTAGLYIVGVVLRGGVAQYNQLAIVQSSEGQLRGQVTSFIGLFSPQRANYRLAFPAGTQVTGGPNQQFLNSRFEPIEIDEAGVSSVPLLADIASVTAFVAETTADLPLQIHSNLTISANGLSGELRNQGQLTLEDATLVYSDTFVPLGTFAAGASAQVQPEAARTTFPSGLNLERSGVFERQSILNILFERDLLRLRSPTGAAASAPVLEGVYLIGWASQPVLPANVNGQDMAQNSLALYVLRLRT